MQRRCTFAIGEYYHVYNRGVDKMKIFRDGRDYERFLILLKTSNTTKKPIHLSNIKNFDKQKMFSDQTLGDLVDIGAYCLLPNHFHLLLKEKVDGGISKFMSKIMTGYSMYFNKKHERSGPLLTKPFRAKHIDDDNYLKYIFAYIHFNVLDIFKKGWRENPNLILKQDYKKLTEYKYSSYPDYYKLKRIEEKILNKEAFPDYFENNPELFKDFIDECLSIKGELYQDHTKDTPWYQGVSLV